MAGRRGLVVPQNTFLDNIIKDTHGTHEHFLLASAQISEAPIVYCSDGFTKMTGYKKSQVVKKKASCSFMFGSLTTKDAVRLLRNAIQEKTSAQIEILLYKRDATPFWVLLNVGLVYNELDEDVLFLLTFQDITEFKEPINPSYRKHRWSELNKALHTKPMPDNPISKAKEEKNRVHIAQLMEETVNILPGYRQEIPATPRYVILHCSTAKIVWDWFILVFILYTATSVPFIVCFKFDSVPMTVADTIVDTMFIIDIILNLHTSFVGDDGTIIFDLQRIRRNYIRSWFFVDLVTSLPYGLLGLIISGGIGRGITDLISFLKAIRLLRLNRVVRALDQYLEYGFITLILWMLFFCLCAHWMACIFFAIADHYDKFAEIGWVSIMAEQTMQPLVIVNGTVKEAPTLASLYMSSLYFSLTSLTSIGFGNIAPNTTAEKIFSCVTMIFGGLCYAVIFGQVTAIVQQAQKKSEGYHQTLDNMRSFCKLYNVPKEISTRIIDYYMYTWVLNRGVDTNQVLLNCPKDLQSDICIHLNRKIIDSTPAFGELSNAVLRAVARNFAIHRVAPGERVVHEGESLDTLYFIGSGSFEVTQKGKVVGLLGEGDVFGDDVCRFNDVGRSVADVFALTYANVHAIGRDELLHALAFYPEYGIQFAKVFRLSYSLRDEMTMRKLSSHPRARSHMMPKGMMDGRRYSLVEEMQQHAYDTDSNVDLGTPNSQNMTDTDPPSKPFIKVTKSHLGVGMVGIPEDGELDPSGDDDDLKRWSEHQNSREVSEGLLNEITGMKSEVRQEIESMGGKMNQLEQNISTILSLLQEQGLKTPGSAFNKRLKTPTQDEARTVSRTASIISRVKSQMPEDILPDWVEMENFGMKGVEQDDGATKQEAEEGNGEEEVKPKKIGGRLTKKRQLDAKRKKKKAEKSSSKNDDEHEDEHKECEVHQDALLDKPLPEYMELPAQSDTPEVVEPVVEKPKSKRKKKKEENVDEHEVKEDEREDPVPPQDVLPDEPPTEAVETPEQPASPEVPAEDTSKAKRKKKRGKKSSKNKDEDPVSSPPQDDSAEAAVVLDTSGVSLQDPQDPQDDLLKPEKPDSPRPKTPAKDAKENEPEVKNEPKLENIPEVDSEPKPNNEPELRNEAELENDDKDSETPDDGRASRQSQPAQPDDPQNPEPPENGRSDSPVATNDKQPSRASTARKSSARSQHAPESPPAEDTPPEAGGSTGETPPSEDSTPRVQSPGPEQENKAPSRVTSAVRQSRQGDVALAVGDSDDDDVPVKKKERPAYVE